MSNSPSNPSPETSKIVSPSLKAVRQMDGGGSVPTPATPEEVFRDFKCRRAALIKALSTDFDKFKQQCDPQKEFLCLYGHPNKTWEVKEPPEEVPTVLPQPTLGINCSRDHIEEKEWLAYVAIHTDSWLLSVASCFGARFGFNKKSRMQLFNMINSLPTIHEVVCGTATRQAKERMMRSSSRRNKSCSKKQEEYGSEQNVQGGHGGENNLCGGCGGNYADDGFWIWCDVCERWFHGICVGITPAQASHIKQYECPYCIRN